MDLPQDLCLELIADFKSKDILWNSRNANYYNSARKEEAWRELADKFGKDIDEVKRKLESLKGSYRREKTRVRKTMERAPKQRYISKWFAFNSLKFLDNKEDKKSGNCSENDIKEQAEEYEEEEEELDNGFDFGQIENGSDPEMEYNSHSVVVKYEPNESMFISPKKIKRKQPEDDQKVSVVFDSLQKASTAVKSLERDESTVFGEHVANKLRKFDDRLRAIAHHKISGIIFELEMTMMDMEFSQTSYAQPDTQLS